MVSLTSNVQIEPREGARLEDVILRAAYCPVGCTAALQVQSIEAKCFCRLRDFLRRWREMFVKMFPNAVWTGPDPSLCSLNRLGGGGALISDTCTTARKARRLLAQLIAEQVQEHLGADKWDAMSESEREAAQRTHEVDCWQHLRNIFLAEMSAAQVSYTARPAVLHRLLTYCFSRFSFVVQTRHVKAELQPELDTFASWERMSTEFSQLLRAAFKEFHHSCRYYKGQGRSFSVWLLEKYGAYFTIHLERADGGRQAGLLFRHATDEGWLTKRVSCVRTGPRLRCGGPSLC